MDNQYCCCVVRVLCFFHCVSRKCFRFHVVVYLACFLFNGVLSGPFLHVWLKSWSFDLREWIDRAKIEAARVHTEAKLKHTFSIISVVNRICSALL